VVIFRGVTAAAIVALIAIESAGPAKAVASPADGAYTYNEPGMPPATWTVSALCDQVSGTRNQSDYSDPVIQAELCVLNIVSTTPNYVSREDRLQTYMGRATLTNDLWTFKVPQPDGVLCQDGSTAPSTEMYSFDDASLAGTHTSVHGAVCGVQPAMSKKPFTLTFLQPLSPPVERYPLYCDAIARCY
jgi:hypothetical protein